MQPSTLLQAMVAIMLYLSPTVIAIGGCYPANWPWAYEMDLYCGDVVQRDNVFASNQPQFGSGKQYIFHFAIDYVTQTVPITFETCMSDFENSISIYTDDVNPTLITDDISSHPCGVDGNGQYLTANLTTGDYIAVVQDSNPAWPAVGYFRLAMRCSDYWYNIAPKDATYAAALSTYRTPTSNCTDALDALEACSTYVHDLEYFHDVQDDVYTGALPTNFVCEDPLDFQPDALVYIHPGSTSTLTCEEVVHKNMGVAMYTMGTSLDASDCDVASAYPGYSVGDVMSIWRVSVPTNACCNFMGFTETCPLSITIFHPPPTNPVPTSAPTYPWASTGDETKADEPQDQTVVIVVAVALSVIVSVALAGFVYVKVHTTSAARTSPTTVASI
eukprot:m.127939 g.127939  ORF g.127939 m.127939 type:complete len:388 (-) comp29306_c0_seq1:553-1716(-)